MGGLGGSALRGRLDVAFTMRPPGPLPTSDARSIPRSLASRRATGEALTRAPGSEPSPTAGIEGDALELAASAEAATAEAVPASDAAAGAPFAGASSPSESTCAITAPTGSASPTAATALNTPAASASYVMFALSVSISAISSPRATVAPSSTSQVRIVPSSIESERRGIVISGIPYFFRFRDASTAPAIRSSFGIAASSRFFAYGSGTSAMPTRSTGASRSSKQACWMRAASSAVTP